MNQVGLEAALDFGERLGVLGEETVVDLGVGVLLGERFPEIRDFGA